MDEFGNNGIRFEDVGLLYGSGPDRLVAVRGLSLTVEPGEAVAVIGPSGCGKSSTLHMLAGILRPTEGRVLVGGEPVVRPRRATAFIPQDLGLLPWKSALENAALGLVIRRAPKAEALARARAALGHVGLAGFERSFPKELSGGMRQRLALARALAMDADLLLMDEPLSAVDALTRETLQDTLCDLQRRRGHTQVLVTHSIEEAVYLGRRIFVLSARPGMLAGAIDNPAHASAGYRLTSEFAAKCREVRTALAAVMPPDAPPPGFDRQGEASR